MEQTRRGFLKSSLAGAAGAASGVVGASAAPARAARADRRRAVIRGPIYNEDDTEFFGVHPAETMSGETVDAWVDGLADAGVGTLVSCVCAMNTNYPSKVWEAHWSRYDPNGPDDQPVFRYQEKESIAYWRRWFASALKLAGQGINLHERAFARCRKHGMGAWASIRMNDVHDCPLEESPLLSTFYKEQRRKGFLRVPYRLASWQDRALDWAREEVRDHYMKLVRELLETQDLDGLELDWMRFGYHFQPGRELEGGRILTAWIGDVRRECERAAKRLGHPVRLGVRVPSNPESARNLGMDGAAWAQDGLIDLLVPTAFWGTHEFGMPMATWRRLLAGTRATLGGGLEVRYQPWPGGPARMVDPELAAGAAMDVLHGGADCVYLFNYFLKGHFGGQWSPEQFAATLRAMRSVDELAKLPRRHPVTYRDVRAPGEPKDDPLPATGTLCSFRVHTGPRPTGRQVELLLEVAETSQAPSPTEVRANGVVCPPARQEGRVFTFTVPDAALADEAHVIEVAAAAPLTIVRVEVAIAG